MQCSAVMNEQLTFSVLTRRNNICCRLFTDVFGI